MRKSNKWTPYLGLFFLPVVILLLMVDPASAGDTSQKKNKEDVATLTPDEAVAAYQVSDEQEALLTQGPPINPGPGLYIKTRGKTAGTIKYFKNGHPDNNSEWEYYGQ